MVSEGEYYTNFHGYGRRWSLCLRLRLFAWFVPEICSLVKPQLTSVDIKSKEICNTVINVLIGKINKKTVPVISIINVELLKRESTL